MNEDMSSLEMRLLALLHQAHEERDETARAELNILLRENAEARSLMPRLLVDEQALVSHLREESIGALITPLALVKPVMKSKRDAAGWFTWFSGPGLAAAAGLVFGIYCTSMVFAYAKPALEKTVILLKDGFESGEAPLVTGVPTAYDAQTVGAGRLHVDDMREGDELAVAKSGNMKLDGDLAPWERVTGDLRLPANTDFLLVHIAVVHAQGPSPLGNFARNYFDDVRLTMIRRAPPQ